MIAQIDDFFPRSVKWHYSPTYNAVIMNLRGTVVAALCASRVAGAIAGDLQKGHNKSSFWRFGQEIGLSHGQIETLGQQYAKASSDADILQVACLVAEAAIGQGYVETSPLNQTVVEENW